jgi:serine/threonine protein kinase
MSASIDKDPTAEGEDARDVLASWLDDFSSGRCDREDMQASFLSVCRSNPDAPWDALALLDQYQRRGKIDAELARSLKTDIAQLVFGAPNQTEPPRDTTEAEAAIDNTGSRWRKLMAEREPESINAEPPFVDPTQFRRDFDPTTRPPPLKQEPRVSPETPRASQQAAPTPAPSVPAARSTGPGARNDSDILRDRYELISVLGRGSTGTVYKAVDRHRAHLTNAARCVAVKVLRLQSPVQPETLAALEREFHQAQSMAHPNVVSVFDLDRDGDRYFIVMEYLEGELLADVLRQLEGRPMAKEHALAIVGNVGAALAHAHRRDIVHADLKPRNIMITSSGEVKVLDFGFARQRALDLHSASGPYDSQPAAPAYASVERVNGSEPHPSDDVYSLACIAYELLSGRHPFGGRSAVHARAHGRSPPRVPGLTHKQSHALQRALLWTRGERKTDIDEFLDALGCTASPGQLVAADELIIPPPSPRRGWQAVGVVLMVIAAIVAVTFFLTQLEDATEPTSAAAPPKPAVQAPPPSPAANEPAPAANAPSTTKVKAAPEKAPQKAPAAVTPKPKSTPPATIEEAPARKNAPVAAPPAADARPVTLSFDKDTYVATESDGSVTVVVRREGSTREPVSFTWSLRANSADAGADYASVGPSSELIPAGQREARLIIPLVSDAIVENTELFLVELDTTQRGVSLGERSHAAVIIVDDD